MGGWWRFHGLRNCWICYLVDFSIHGSLPLTNKRWQTQGQRASSIEDPSFFRSYHLDCRRITSYVDRSEGDAPNELKAANEATSTLISPCHSLSLSLSVLCLCVSVSLSLCLSLSLFLAVSLLLGSASCAVCLGVPAVVHPSLAQALWVASVILRLWLFF